jgi:2-oxoglutarate ferredoxin oxidoreductase subunit alpha
VLRRYEQVLVPEMNLGQLAMLLRAEFLVDAISYTRVRGRPLSARELEEAITTMVATT